MNSIIFALIFSMAIPILVMVLLTRSLEDSAPRQANYRGRLVYNGLGIVWFVWLLSFWIGAHLFVMAGIEQPLWVTYIIPIFPLIAGTVIFGLLDDWVGDSNAKGFRGHLRAMLHLTITTGGLKMLGIGFLSFFTAVSLYWDGIYALPRVLLVTCAIALMANFMNLFDLRPGRAGKAYVVILLLAILSLSLSAVVQMKPEDVAAIALTGIGPLLAVWRYDLGEKGMLGDCGANSMGAFLGFIFATSLPMWALAILVLLLLALNILSERFSFSRIIDACRPLSWLDNLWRKR
ncbi:MAG: hypothetical protein LBG97_01230 [Coriobacteriales bacterium]|jgi:hypothetical protein|nr:hypothetical protein [Coriobacteriales bacterium]